MVVATALGMKPDGVPSKKETACAFCGSEIHIGDLCVPFSVGGAFMDARSFAAPGSETTCGYCIQVLSAEGLRLTGHGLFSLDNGFALFRKWKDIAAGLENPPAGTFVAVRATANNQHMAWRAPVNMSRDLFYVRVGLRDLKIRRPILLKAVEVSVKLGEAAGILPSKKSLSHPFAILDPDLKDVSHGRLRTTNGIDKTPITIWYDKYPEEIKFIHSLTLGETWGLRFLLSPNAGEEA
jgi:CRISPR type IV-associated protein Csf1